MPDTKARLREYWDAVILKKIPPHAEFHKVEDELKEHYSLLVWSWKSFLLPLIALYVILGIIFHNHIIGSLFTSLLVFFYSNFLPDADVLVTRPQPGEKESLWYEIYFLLCFAPLVLFYVVNGKANPLHTVRSKPFHNLSAVFVWGVFLLIVASLFWPDDTLKKIMLPLFGMAGFSFHLMVDGIINFFWMKKRPQWPKQE